MEKANGNSRPSIEETLSRLREQQKMKLEQMNKERLEIREETNKKLKASGEILKENLRIQGIIEGTLKELKLNLKPSMKKTAYFIIIICTVIISLFISWKFKLFNSNMKAFIIPGVLGIALIICTAYGIIQIIKEKRAYKNYIYQCKNRNISNEDMNELVKLILDNYAKLSDILLPEFFRYFTAEYRKTDFDLYINFICKNNKPLWRKYKSRKLLSYKGIYSLNMDMQLAIEEIENNYFKSSFNVVIVDTLHDCIDKFIKNNMNVYKA